MSKANAALGPWEARGRTIWEPGKVAMSIASVNQHHPDAAQITRLIAAAPDVLAALEQIAEGLASEPPKLSRSMAAHIAAAAIAKAKGS